MNEMIPDRRCSIWFSNKAEPGTSIRGAFEFIGGAQSCCVCVCCVCAICDRVQLLTLPKGQSLSYVLCFIGFTSLSKSITFSKEGRGWKVGGTVTRLLFATRLITKLICLNAE